MCNCGGTQTFRPRHCHSRQLSRTVGPQMQRWAWLCAGNCTDQPGRGPEVRGWWGTGQLTFRFLEEFGGEIWGSD